MQHFFSTFFLASTLFALFHLTAVSQPVLWDTISAGHPRLLYSSSDLHGFRQRIAGDARTKNLYLQILTQSRARSDEQIARSRTAKSGAFVMSIGMKEDGGLLTEGEISSISEMLKTYLDEIDPAVQANSSEYQWRAVELMQFCEAYDFYRGWSMPPDTSVERTLATFADGMNRELKSPIIPYNNLTLKLAGALGMAALTLKNAQSQEISDQTTVWLTTSLDFIEKTFFENQTSESNNAGYSEGPYYFRYGMMSLIPYFQALDRVCGANSIVVGSKTYTNPVHDARYWRIFQWIAALRMPDGRLPAFEDTYMNTRFPELAILGKIGPKDPHYAWMNFTGTTPLSDNELFSFLSETYDGRIEYFCADARASATPAGIPLVSMMPDAGYLVYRSSWSPEATYFAMIGKHDRARTGGSVFGSGHKHANETGFIMASGGELLAIEPGYYQYSYRDSLIFGKNHNIILVDGKGPDQTSLLSFLIGADTYIEDTLSSQWGSVSTTTTTYQNATIARTSVFYNNKYVILRDVVSSASPHKFTHQIHGYGLQSAGSFRIDTPGTGVWQRGDMQLFANVSSPSQPLAFETPVRKHAPSYMTFEDHTALYSSANGTAATFQTMLVPAPVPAAAVFQEVDSAFNAHAVSCVAGSDIFVSAIAESNGAFRVKTAVGAIESDAAFGIIGADQSTEVTLFLEKAKNCSLNGFPVFASSAPSTLFTHIASKSIDLTLQSSVRVVFSLLLNFEPDTIEGRGFTWAMNGNRLVVTTFGGRAEMRIHLSNTPTGVENPNAPAADVFDIYPNPVTQDTRGINVSFTSHDASPSTISIYNTSGAKIRSFDSGSEAAGRQSVFIPLYGIPSGIYFIEVASPAGTNRKAFVVR